MAEEKKDAKAAEAAKPADGTATAGGGKKKLIIIIAAVLVLLLGGGGAAFFLLGGKKEDPATGHGEDGASEEHGEAKTEEGHATEGGGHGEAKKEDGKSGGEHGEAKKEDGKAGEHGEKKKEDGKGGEHGEAKKEEGKGAGDHGAPDEHGKTEGAIDFGSTHAFKTFHVNLGNPLENRYMRLEVSVEYRGGEEQKKEIVAREAQLRDAIISVTSKRTRESLLAPDGRDQLRREILIRLNRFMTKPLESVFITDMLIE